MAPPPPLLPLVFLLMVVGASGAEWSVNYNQEEICALNGSTVFNNGSFTLPDRLTVTQTFWVIDPPPKVLPPDLNIVPDYSGRVEYLVSEQKHFSLRLSNVMKKDEHWYCFRIITNDSTQKWMGRPGVKLRVTELHVESPEEVTEGESAVLTCSTTCSLTDPTFIWFKDGRPLPTNITQKNQLHLQTVSSEDTGSYSCAVRGSEHLHSTAQTLRLRHPPQNVSVSINPSGGIVEGSSVTLTCSSDAYPPVENYTWFKDGGRSPVGSGQSYSITSITADHTGLYYCEAQNAVGAQNGSVMIQVQHQISSAVWIAVGGEGGGFLLLLFLMVSVCIYRMKNRAAGTEGTGYNQHQSRSTDETYTALNPQSRSTDETYTALNPQSRATDDTYTALQPRARSSDDEYQTLTNVGDIGHPPVV